MSLYIPKEFGKIRHLITIMACVYIGHTMPGTRHSVAAQFTLTCQKLHHTCELPDVCF